MWAIAISGWVVAIAILWWTKRAVPRSGTEAQLQQTARDFAKARKNHQAQIDAVRASVVEFELNGNVSDPAAVKQVLDDVLSKTKMRGERA